ncbi:retron Ec48 family effector membrane protein [Halomonas koreensis]|uniref:Retron Ec48 family effector membrane protein n=1 Tax=Halomonas koreensis TaxID=245385 RepID=A0ABU1G7B9_9GAMM|nr:retron Ec48 family effector membrane protein [Halomonas koreensis]MDR5868448.1 retron Ec48 family effector membrane protein [Halomonas koreensis]
MKSKNQALGTVAAITIPPILLAASLGFLIYPKEGLSFCFTRECFVFFYDFFNLPIKLLAYSFTFFGILAAIFTSVSTAQTTKIAKQQAAFNNFLAHRADFTEHIKEEKDRLLPLINHINYKKLYNYIHAESKYGDLSISTQAREKEKSIKQSIQQNNDLIAQPNGFDFDRHREDISGLSESLGVSLVHIEDHEHTQKHFCELEKNLYKLLWISICYWERSNLIDHIESIKYDQLFT